jgi:hypothetical protein
VLEKKNDNKKDRGREWKEKKVNELKGGGGGGGGIGDRGGRER